MRALCALFEEDLEMQDAIEDLDLFDNSDDMIIGTIEDRYNDSNKNHIFENEEIDEDGLTREEETEINAILLNSDDDIDEEELIDDDF